MSAAERKTEDKVPFVSKLGYLGATASADAVAETVQEACSGGFCPFKANPGSFLLVCCEAAP